MSDRFEIRNPIIPQSGPALSPKSDCIDKIGELAELAASLLADARSLRDRVAELEHDGMEIPALVDAADCLHAAAGAAARELAAVDNDFNDWMSLSETRGAR
jgi:hypothetical protein